MLKVVKDFTDLPSIYPVHPIYGFSEVGGMRGEMHIRGVGKDVVKIEVDCISDVRLPSTLM
ncbi:hypothetical protein YTPLAS72_27410 [Nitrospira sp.]|nr:hypothetical protein YTPLAS72_27410 [Nitrospira sp.]